MNIGKYIIRQRKRCTKGKALVYIFDWLSILISIFLTSCYIYIHNMLHHPLTHMITPLPLSFPVVVTAQRLPRWRQPPLTSCRSLASGSPRGGKGFVLDMYHKYLFVLYMFKIITWLIMHTWSFKDHFQFFCFKETEKTFRKN